MALKLSFILPCYNVERYIADCLDSLYAQDLADDEFEVICVNDCSTDGTRDIVQKFAMKHPNLILVDHERNMTVGGARNTGLNRAKGEYIWFVDPDDMVKKGVAKELYEKASGECLDLLMFNFETVDESQEPIKVNLAFVDSVVMSGQEFVVSFFSNRFSELCIVWRGLFKKEFLEQQGLRFPNMRKGEDVSFLWKALLVADRVDSVREVYYTYRRNPYSVTHKRLDARVAFSERMLFANEIYEMLTRHDLSFKVVIRNDMERTLLWCVNNNLNLIHQMTLKERSRYYDEIKNNLEIVCCLRAFMNRKQRCLFSIVEGRWLWLLKVMVMCLSLK